MKRILLFVAVMIGWSLFFTASGFSQGSSDLNELKREIEALKASQNAIQKDLQTLIEMLKPRQAPPVAAGPTPENPTICQY
jgi:predicted transcriptional regulator